MNEAKEIDLIKTKNCTIHVCGDSITKTKKEQERIWEEFSRYAYELCVCVKK